MDSIDTLASAGYDRSLKLFKGFSAAADPQGLRGIQKYKGIWKQSVRLKRKAKSVRLKRKAKSIQLKRKGKSVRLKRKEHTQFPNSDSELKGSTRGQKIGTRIPPQLPFPLLLGFFAGVIQFEIFIFRTGRPKSAQDSSTSYFGDFIYGFV